MSILTSYNRLKLQAIIWFVRCSWPVVLLWGLYDLVSYSRHPNDADAEDAAIRIAGGVILFLIWLFCVRTKGPWTLNRNNCLLE